MVSVFGEEWAREGGIGVQGHPQNRKEEPSRLTQVFELYYKEEFC